MKFRLAARLEILALSALGAAVAGCAGGPSFSAARTPAKTSIAAAKIPAERLLVVADVFEKQGNLEKAQQLYAHVEKTNPDLSDEIQARTQSLALRRDSRELVSRKEPVSRSRARTSQSQSQRRDVSRGAVPRPTPQAEEETERPAVETWATLKMRVSDRGDQVSQPQPARKVSKRTPKLELASAAQKAPETDVDGWKSSNRRGVQTITAQSYSATHEPDAQQDEAVRQSAFQPDESQREEPQREESRREESLGEIVQREELQAEREEVHSREVQSQELQPKEVQPESVEVEDHLLDDKLIRQLKSENPDVRRAAALDVGQLQTASDKFLPALREALVVEGTPRTRLQIADAILRHAPNEVEPFRVLLKSSSDWDSETAVVSRVLISAHLARNPSISERQSRMLLKDADPAVRSAAQWNLKVADGLRSEKSPKVQLVGGIAEVSKAQPTRTVRRAHHVE